MSNLLLVGIIIFSLLAYKSIMDDKKVSKAYPAIDFQDSVYFCLYGTYSTGAAALRHETNFGANKQGFYERKRCSNTYGTWQY